MHVNIPQEIVDILFALEEEKEVSENDITKLDTFLSGLEHAINNPACPAKVLCNPIPNEDVLAHRNEPNLEDRIKHINSVSARIRAMQIPESDEEAQDFSELDDSFLLLPRSIFEVADHEAVFVEEDLTPSPSRQEVPEPGPVSEAAVSTPQED